MDAGGTNPVNLTNNSAEDYEPAWSPDGTMIAFKSYRNGIDGEIFVMDAGGTNPVNLTDNDAEDFEPAWKS
jgi:TolB protein